MEAADLDGDGRTDLVAWQIDPQDAFFADIYWLRQSGTGQLLAPQRLPTERACTPDGFAVADVDADGRLDLFVSNLRCPPQWVKHEPDGRFTLQATIGNTRVHGPRALRLAADAGRAALLASTETSLVMFRQTALGSFGPSVEVAPAGSTGWITGDVDGDGRDDVVLTGIYGGGPWVVRLRRQLADGSLGEPQDVVVGGEAELGSPQLADLNGDGRADVVTSSRVRFGRLGAGGAAASKRERWRPGHAGGWPLPRSTSTPNLQGSEAAVRAIEK